MEKETFYYIDKEGNKKKYYGKIIKQPNGTYNGILTISNKVNVKKDLIYHEEIPQVNGYASYYSYINSNGEEVNYYGNILKDENKNPYFTYVERNTFNLEYHPEVLPVDEYFTYTDSQGNEQIYTGKELEYNKKLDSYFGVVKK